MEDSRKVFISLRTAAVKLSKRGVMRQGIWMRAPNGCELHFLLSSPLVNGYGEQDVAMRNPHRTTAGNAKHREVGDH